MKKGFTLVELIAVVVILGIILVLAVPRITNIINNIQKNAFETDTKMVLNAVRILMSVNEDFDVSILNTDNINNILGIDNSNYKNLKFDEKDGELYIKVQGKNRWDNLVIAGTGSEILAQEGLVLWLDASNPLSYSGEGDIWYDLSGNDNHGTINSPIFNDSYFEFNGQTGAIEIPHDDSLNPGNEITITAWFRLREGVLDYVNETGEMHTIVHKGNPNQVDPEESIGFWMSYDNRLNRNRLWYQVGDSEGSWGRFVGNQSAFHLEEDTEYFTAMVVKNQSLAGYIDTMISGWASFNGVQQIDNDGILRIGARRSLSDRVMNGFIGEVRIYDRALSDNELRQIYNATKYKYIWE